MINRVIFWLSLAGMILALHLWIQKARDFDQGCFGTSKPAVVASGCTEVSALPSSHLFGVSNAAWGYAFYFTLALISFAKILAPPERARRLHRVGEALVAGGFLYSVYLVGVMVVVAHAVCLLCLTSALLVTTLLILHAVLRRRGGFQPVAEAARGLEVALAGGGAFAAAGVLVGVLLFVNRLGTRPLDAGSEGRELTRIIGNTLPKFIDPEKLATMRTCRFEWSVPPLDLSKFISPATPFRGKPDGVRIMVFVDPNCGHCRAYLPTFLAAMEKFKDRARFTIVPRVLWDQSIPQAAALKLAEGSGKYFELWQTMFDRQVGPRNGMSTEQIAGIFRELGIDATDLDRRIAALRPAILAAKGEAELARMDAVPAVYFEQRQVWVENEGLDCLGTLLERVESGFVKLR